MRIDPNRDSSHENEESIAWFKATGRTPVSASFDAVPAYQFRTDSHIPTTGLRAFLPDPKPYSVMIDQLGKSKVDWGID